LIIDGDGAHTFSMRFLSMLHGLTIYICIRVIVVYRKPLVILPTVHLFAILDKRAV